jgi:PAS domain S-box-containing protein
MTNKKNKSGPGDDILKLQQRIALLEDMDTELEARLAEMDREKRRIQKEFEIHLAETIRFQNSARLDLERYQALVANIPGAVYRCANDPEWTMEFMSDQIEVISGYPASDFIHNAVRSYASIISHDDVFHVVECVNKGLEEAKPYLIDYRITHRDGSLRWVSEKGRGVFSKDGDLLWLDGVIFDVTDQTTFFGIADISES